MCTCWFLCGKGIKTFWRHVEKKKIRELILRDTISTTWGLDNVAIKCKIQTMTLLRTIRALLHETFLDTELECMVTAGLEPHQLLWGLTDRHTKCASVCAL